MEIVFTALGLLFFCVISDLLSNEHRGVHSVVVTALPFD